jgi:hypothetical protein
VKTHKVVRCRGSYIFSRQSAHRWRKVISLTRRPPLTPPGRFLALNSFRGWVDPRATVWLEGLGQLKYEFHRDLNPRPSGWMHSASTNYATACPNFLAISWITIISHLNVNIIGQKSKSKLCYDRRFSRPICLGIKHPSGAYDQIFVTVRHLQACWSGALSQVKLVKLSQVI